MAPIHGAAEQGNLEEVTRLIEEDPEIVDAIDGYNHTALHFVPPLKVVWRWCLIYWTKGQTLIQQTTLMPLLCIMPVWRVVKRW